MTKTYPSWERANIAFEWAYGFKAVMCAWDETDNEAECEQDVLNSLADVHREPWHPLKLAYSDNTCLVNVFNQKYPRA